MSWAGTELVDVHLDAGHLLIVDAGGSVLPSAHGSAAEALGALGAWASSQRRGAVLRLWLGGSVCRPFLAPPVGGLRGQAEWRRAVSAVVHAATGIASPCMVWLDAAKKGKPRAGAAIESAFVDSTIKEMASRGVHLSTMRPWWSDVLRVALERRPALEALAVRDGNTLTWLAGAGGSFSALRSFDRVSDDASAEALIGRAALSANIDLDSVCRVSLRAEARPSADLPAAEWQSLALARCATWAEGST